MEVILHIMGNKKSHHLTEKEMQKIKAMHGMGELKLRPAMTDQEISDAIIGKDNILARTFHASFTLDDDKGFLYKGHEFMKTYCEGGLTADDWSKTFTFNPKLLFTRQIVSTLKEKRNQAFADDLKQGTSQDDLDQRLSMVWSGANDLVTVNSHPTYEAAYRAIQAIKQHLLELIKHGRKNIVVANMPDLSLTPRYQIFGKEDSHISYNAQQVTNYYNKLLRELITDIQGASIKIFDVNKEFSDIYNNVKENENNEKLNPLKLKKDKLALPYKDSADYKPPKENGGTSPSTGYMFDDDLHPTADVHAFLGTKLDKFLNRHFDFQPPEKIPVSAADMVLSFKERYIAEMNAHDSQGFFSLPRTFGLRKTIHNIIEDGNGLNEILSYALFNGDTQGGRARQIMRDLCWFDRDGKVNRNYPCLLPQSQQPQLIENNDLKVEI